MANCDHQGKGVKTERKERISSFKDEDKVVHCIKTIEVLNFCEGCGDLLGQKAWNEDCP